MRRKPPRAASSKKLARSATQRSRADEPVGVRIDLGEVALRARIKAAGGRWDLASKVCRMARVKPDRCACRIVSWRDD
jgi:hypothetical protein